MDVRDANNLKFTIVLTAADSGHFEHSYRSMQLSYSIFVCV